MARASINIDINDSRVQTSAASIGRLSKQQEIDLVKALARQLPDSYLKDMLSHIQIQFESDVRSDFPCIPNLRQIEIRCNELGKQESELKGTVDQLQQDLMEIKRTNCNLVSSIRATAMTLRDDAQRATNVAQLLIRATDEIMHKAR